MVLRRTPVGLTRPRSLLLIALLIGTGCGSNGDYDNDDDDTAASHPANPTVVTADEQSVPEALRFRASRVGGGEIDMSTLAGKPVVMWFWAPY